jgi:hypothetical protein
MRRLQRFISDVIWDEEQMRYQLVAEEMGDPEGVLIFDETGFVKKGRLLWGSHGRIVAPWAACGRRYGPEVHGQESESKQ